MLDDHDGNDNGEDQRHGDADDGHDAAKAEHVALIILLVLEKASLDISRHCCGVKHASGKGYCQAQVQVHITHLSVTGDQRELA